MPGSELWTVWKVAGIIVDVEVISLIHWKFWLCVCCITTAIIKAKSVNDFVMIYSFWDFYKSKLLLYDQDFFRVYQGF